MSKQEQQDYAMFLEKLTITEESLEATRMDAMEKGIQIGEEKGMKIGEEKGIEKGIHHGEYLKAMATAEKLVLRGFDNDDIADITGLSMDEIEDIRKRLN